MDEFRYSRIIREWHSEHVDVVARQYWCNDVDGKRFDYKYEVSGYVNGKMVFQDLVVPTSTRCLRLGGRAFSYLKSERRRGNIV